MLLKHVTSTDGSSFTSLSCQPPYYNDDVILTSGNSYCIPSVCFRPETGPTYHQPSPVGYYTAPVSQYSYQYSTSNPLYAG